MSKKMLTFGNIEIEKNFFTEIRLPFFKKDVDIEKVLLYNKICFGEKNYKYFKVKPLHIMLPKKSAYVKRYDGQTKWMYFLIEDDDLLENIMLFGIKPVLI